MLFKELIVRRKIKYSRYFSVGFTSYSRITFLRTYVIHHLPKINRLFLRSINQPRYCLRHHFVDPGNEFLDIGIDSRQVLPSASDAPGDEPYEGPPAFDGQGQGTARVALARVTSTLEIWKF